MTGFVGALADGPAALLVEGDAGIGKTTVWRAAAAAAHERSYRVISATAVESSRSEPPYADRREPDTFTLLLSAGLFLFALAVAVSWFIGS